MVRLGFVCFLSHSCFLCFSHSIFFAFDVFLRHCILPLSWLMSSRNSHYVMFPCRQTCQARFGFPRRPLTILSARSADCPVPLSPKIRLNLRLGSSLRSHSGSPPELRPSSSRSWQSVQKPSSYEKPRPSTNSEAVWPGGILGCPCDAPRRSFPPLEMTTPLAQIDHVRV